MEKKKTVILRNVILGDGIPKICVPLVGETRDEILKQAQAAAAEVPDLVEWRVDCYREIQDEGKAAEVLSALSAILRQIPILFTFRTTREGGKQEILPEAYRNLNLWAAGRPEVDLIDIEGRWAALQAVSLVSEIQKKGKPVIASNHFFDRTPTRQEMVKVFEELENTGADLLKLAVMPACPEDVLELLQVTVEMDRRWSKPVVTMSMGELGSISRISGRLTGSALTFAAVGAVSAPGQLPIHEMRQVLNLL